MELASATGMPTASKACATNARSDAASKRRGEFPVIYFL
jgi:hypothetical protein